jgi:molybdenum cofactor cytidylyltransferase
MRAGMPVRVSRANLMSSLIQRGARFAAIILAAGRSSRMGRPKLLLPWGKTTILGHLLGEWQRLGAEQIAVVCAEGDANLQLAVKEIGPEVCIICNPAPERGMFSSIRCAAQWSGWTPGLTHWAVVLGDQPHVRFQTLRALVEFSAAHPSRVCQPGYRGHTRHPVFLPKEVFMELFASSAAHMKEFLAGREIAMCELDEPGLDLDIDRLEDYENALRMWSNAESSGLDERSSPRSM